MTLALLDALLAGSPDGLILCDALLRPVRASAAVPDAAITGEETDLAWATTPLAAACREAAALALDRGGTAAVGAAHNTAPWEIRAAPLGHPHARVCVTLRPGASAERETVLRAAHDLKAPLHAVAGFATLLEREQLGPLTLCQLDAVRTMAGETTRLKTALGALVERARTGDSNGCPTDPTTTCPPPATDLGAVARRAVERFAALAATAGATLLAPDTSLPAALPETDATTILENLLANAVAAGATHVRVVTEPHGATGSATLRVEDDGPGVPAELLERIFEPRVRVDDRGAPGGSGLGLTISRALAERAGGTLAAAQRTGGGAVFTLRLPVAQPDAPRVLRVAPVTSHAALARACAALDTTLGADGRWRHAGWEGGVLSVELPASDMRPVAAALDRVGLTSW
ncbi:MAG TPA: HAMP domain-containing sensor histidine kinase [Chloroflexota bacterium]|nr:HAMP domain-containing sensor histidine kinase [Chloroflexota bacterium]